MFKVKSVAETKQLIFEKMNDYNLGFEEIDYYQSIKRILAEDIIASENVPHFNRSTVDGYAVKSSDLVGAGESFPGVLTLLGEVEMGKSCELTINDGEAIYVPTGGFLPNGADCVVMIENTEKMADDEVFIYYSPAVKENILFAGDDVKINTPVLKKGQQVRPQDIGVLSSLGITKVKVIKQIKVTVISTGDEIISPEETPKLGQVRDINSYTISSLAENMGMVVIDKMVINDSNSVLLNKVSEAIDNSDLTILSGGSSVGVKDYTATILNQLEENSVFVHGIAVKPGKPTLLAKVRGKLVFGLPGQPASALMIFKIFIDDIINALMKLEVREKPYNEAILTRNVQTKPGRETYQMVKVYNKDGKIFAEPVLGKSGMITLLSQANGYIVIPTNIEGLTSGSTAKVYML